MGLLDGLEPRKHIHSCKIRTIAADLDDDDRAVFLAAVENKDWAPTPLAAELTQRGIGITKDPIQKHRMGTCSCSKI